MKCLNENCPLNKDENCDNDVVLGGRGSCDGKSIIQKKRPTGWNSGITRPFKSKAAALNEDFEKAVKEMENS